MHRFLAVLTFCACAYAQTVVTLTSPGSSTWTAPAGVTSIKVECIGGGGGGATMTSSGGGGGGGGGAYAVRTAASVTPGVAYSYTIGSAGATNGGGNGGTTTFTADGGVQCIAVGGNSVANNTATAGAGGLGSASTGDTKFNGGSGANGVAGSYGGGGGGSGGSASNGTTATNATGATAVTGGGPGGNGKSSPQGTGGAPANGPGGGGGGGLRTSSGTRSGGAGWAGQIKITYLGLTTAVSDGLPVVASVDGLYSNNSAKTASVSENIQYVSSDQSRWGMSASQVARPSDLGGRGYFAAITEAFRGTENSFGIVPAENYAVEVVERIQYTPSDQSRLAFGRSELLARSETVGTGVAGALHLTASVTESIPYTPSSRFEWSADPSPEGAVSREGLSQAYSPGVPPSAPVPRRPAVIR